MKKLYSEPTIEVVFYKEKDVIRASSVFNGSNSGETPLPEATTPEFDWDNWW